MLSTTTTSCPPSSGRTNTSSWSGRSVRRGRSSSSTLRRRGAGARRCLAPGISWKIWPNPRDSGWLVSVQGAETFKTRQDKTRQWLIRKPTVRNHQCSVESLTAREISKVRDNCDQRNNRTMTVNQMLKCQRIQIFNQWFLVLWSELAQHTLWYPEKLNYLEQACW